MGDDDSLRTTTADKVLGADIGGANACFARLAPVVGLLFCMPKYGAGTMLFGEVTAAAFVVATGWWARQGSNL